MRRRKGGHLDRGNDPEWRESAAETPAGAASGRESQEVRPQRVRGAVQAGRPVTAIGIQGGPICDVEQREMVGLVNLMKANLRALGLKPDIELDMNLPTFERFARKYGL